MVLSMKGTINRHHSLLALIPKGLDFTQIYVPHATRGCHLCVFMFMPSATLAMYLIFSLLPSSVNS
jgi:hypothetical protein